MRTVLSSEREDPAMAEQEQDTKAATKRERTSTTKAETFQDASQTATPAEVGYLGTSTERERVGGAEDKGLSQRNPAILNGGPVPDSRTGVDDSEAIAGLKG